MRKYLFVSTILLFTLAIKPVFADTVFCVNCSNEIMDMMRQAQNLAQYTQQTSNMISQLEVLRAQAARLTSLTPTSQTNSVLTSIMGMANQGQVLGYNLQNIEKRFQDQYPSYGESKGNYYQNYSKWSATTSDSLKAALRASGMQMDNFANEAATADTLRVMNASAGGQMQAIQIGNAVSSELLDELRKLRTMQATQNQAQNAYLLGAQQSGDQSEAELEKMFKPTNSSVRTVEENAKLRKARQANELQQK